jgi:hypothetical protein
MLKLATYCILQRHDHTCPAQRSSFFEAGLMSAENSRMMKHEQRRLYHDAENIKINIHYAKSYVKRAA